MRADRFPVQVRRGIEDLFAQLPALVKQRSTSEHTRIRAHKLSKLRFLESYFISRASADAAVRMIWRGRVPFCLFLRSFVMGHQVINDAESDVESLLTHEPVGGRLLHALAETLSERAALIAIANPDEWLPHRLIAGPFANLVLGPQSWQDVVSSLVRASQLIVVHRAEASAGVNRELELIRSSGRSASTIVVRDPVPLTDSSNKTYHWLPLDLWARIKRRERAREAALEGHAISPDDVALAGFENVIEWRDEETMLLQLAGTVRRLIETAPKISFDLLPPFKSPDTPEEIALYLHDAQSAYDFASQCLRAGEFAVAEELLFECFASGCAAIDVGGRASALRGLGRLFLRIGAAEDARVALEYASGHFVMIGKSDLAVEALHLFAAALLLSKDFESANFIVEQADVWQTSDDMRAWRRQFWEEMSKQADAATRASISAVCAKFEPDPSN